MSWWFLVVASYRRTAHVTPKSYLSFINGYKTIYTEKHGTIAQLANRMQTGLDKLIEASESVAQLSKELAIKEKDLAVASKKAEAVRSQRDPRTLFGRLWFLLCLFLQWLYTFVH